PPQILRHGGLANGATARDLPLPHSQLESKSENFLDLSHGQPPGWQADPPFRGRLACHFVVQRYSPRDWSNIPLKPISVPPPNRRVIGFPAERVIGLRPER